MESNKKSSMRWCSLSKIILIGTCISKRLFRGKSFVFEDFFKNPLYVNETFIKLPSTFDFFVNHLFDHYGFAILI